MSSCLEEGDFRGAVKLASTSSTVAEASEETFIALQDKHLLPAVTLILLLLLLVIHLLSLFLRSQPQLDLFQPVLLLVPIALDLNT